MGFESSHVFTAPRPADPVGWAIRTGLPIEIAFLRAYRIDAAVLRAAAETALCDDVCPAVALIAYGGVTATFYYRALADVLGSDFIDNQPILAPTQDFEASCRAGCVALAAGHEARLIAAPRDERLRSLLNARRRRWPEIAITTPAHLATILRDHMQDQVEHVARDALPMATPRLSAKGALDTWAAVGSAAALAVGILGLVTAPALVGDFFGALFFAGASFRLAVSAGGLAPVDQASPRAIPRADLPTYSVLVPLRDEAALVPDLIVALEAIDYPRGKLEVFVLLEPEDRATRHALASALLPPWLHVVVGPAGGSLRTKPRALNIGLQMARGELLTVYDAEDRPDPDQLRRAAALFRAEPDLVCAQARLAIDNGANSLLARLFAIEYAALFDVFNVGIVSLGFPLALGGTSNHFRTSILRKSGGWDAWNVTEDADLGLRLARLGHRVACLSSTTREAAPDRLTVWMKQRRRWTKGWMQTFLVLARDMPRVMRTLGWAKSLGLVPLLINLVVGPLLFPVFFEEVLRTLLSAGAPTPHGTIELVEATLDVSVLLLGIASTLWCGYAGVRARGLQRFLPWLPLMLPYQFMISLAAWMGLADLVLQPFHWHKTDHRAGVRGLTRRATTSIVHRAQSRGRGERRAGDRCQAEGA
jgi:hypothetical protein